VMKKVGPEISPKACTWPVQTIYLMKNVGSETSSTACIQDEKSWSRDYPYIMHIPCTA
jgi:hypothetical protein